MPEWFRTLGYITLASIMVLFLLSIAGVIVIAAIVSVKELITDRRIKRRRKGNATDIL